MAYGFNDDKSKFDLNVILDNFGTVETGNTASQAYAAGDLLVYDSRLYRASSSIAQGDTFTVGTNIEEITVAAVSIMPPDVMQKETVPGASGSNLLDKAITIPKDGWYAVETNKSTVGLTLAEAYILVNINDSWHYVASVSDHSEDNIDIMTPWMFFKEGAQIKVGGMGTYIETLFAPCL